MARAIFHKAIGHSDVEKRTDQVEVCDGLHSEGSLCYVWVSLHGGKLECCVWVVLNREGSLLCFGWAYGRELCYVLGELTHREEFVMFWDGLHREGSLCYVWVSLHREGSWVSLCTQGGKFVLCFGWAYTEGSLCHVLGGLTQKGNLCYAWVGPHGGKFMFWVVYTRKEVCVMFG